MRGDDDRADERGASAALHGAPSRRSFLGGAAAIGAFAVLGRAAPALAEPQVGDQAWRELSRKLSGRLLRPGDRGFLAAALPSNLRYADRLPAGIARCRTPEDVSTAIQWCREHGVRLAPRGGGHNYGGYSTTKGLLIETHGLDRIRFDEATGRLTVGAGVKNRDVGAALANRGVAIVHGRCKGVGVAGFLLGGGIGFDMRLHGIGSDLLVATDIILADGELYRADANANEDLFFACRGGAGGNFGINTSFVLNTFEVGSIAAFDITWSRRQEEVLEALVAAMQEATPRFGVKLSLAAASPEQQRNGRDIRVNALGQLHGSRRELLEILAPASALAEPSKRRIEVLPYWEGQEIVSEEGPPEYFRERSRFVTKPFGGHAIERACRFARRFPGTEGGASLKLFQTGAAVNDTPAGETAFVHRDSQWLMSIATVWEAHEKRAAVLAANDWLDEYYDAMLPFCSEGAFQNFSDPSLVDWPQQYYGTNLRRLRKIKTAVDPDELFRFRQSIRPLG
jgi:FAD/FMN-containing dehydrogenase